VSGAADEIVELAGAARERYATLGARLVGDRRINRSFVPPRDLKALFQHLIAPSAAALDARATLAVDRRSGLPTLPEFLRARARMRAVSDGPGLDRFRVEARVRRARGKTADIKVVVDRFDPANCRFRRAVLELHVDGCSEVALEGDHATLSGHLRDTLFRFATAPPRLLCLRMSDVGGVHVTRLSCGTTGPLVFAGMEVPQALAPVLSAHPDAMILVCTLTQVALSDGDPMERDDPFLFAAADVITSLRAAQPGRVIYSV